MKIAHGIWAIAAVGIVAACASGQEIRFNPNGGGTTYTAEVLAVERGPFPLAQLALDVQGMGERCVEPYYVPSRERIDFTNAVTQQNLVCYYLLAGDRIRFDIMGSPKDPLITNVSRVGTRGRIPPARPGSGAGGDVVRTSLETDRWTYRVGETVRFVFTITNASAEPIALTMPSGQPYEFVVYENEREVWRWSQGKTFTQALRTHALKPGESLIFSESWDQRLTGGRRASAGVYKLVAELPARGLDKPTAWATITISED